ncbi:GBP3-like protein [Mya arenaria]|uniref:GBP3-like protein n=1 Tax=Mya arenaria TaxID=6604 RepID=A0ABY7GBA5_MYAAR|nr:GBP3-like protein [Mya arenaria]
MFLSVEDATARYRVLDCSDCTPAGAINMIQNESYVDSLANRDLQSQSGKHPEQDETTRKSFSENRVKRNIQQDAEYESTTSEDMPTDAYKLKKRQTSPTSSARYKARHYSDSKLAEKLESFSNYEKEHWSEDGLEVFQRPLCLVSAGYKNVLQVDQSVLGQLRKIILPCVIVAVVGLYRTGKSYLMNRLADADKGDADVLDKLEELPFDALSKRFQEPTFEFMKFIFNQEPKQLMNSKPVTGSMLAVLTDQYVEALRQGVVPDVLNAIEVVAEMENTKVKNAALAIFKEGLVDQKMPVPYKQLDDHFQSVQWTALEYIRKNAMLDGKHNVEKDVQSYMEIIWVNRKSENEQHIFEYCENSLEALQSKSTLIAGIQDKSYADIGGHRKFKHDLERVRQEYNLELKDKGYGNRETAVTWSTFKQTLTDAEMEIVRLDDALSEDVKNREREEFKQEMQKTVREMEEQYKQSFEEQRKSYEAHEKEIKKQRDEQNQEHKEKMNKLIQEIAQLKEYVVECQSRDKKIQLLENENKKIRKMEMQLREENEKKRDEDFRQWRKDEKEQFERTVEDMRTVQQKGDETEKELRNLKEEKERKESERKKLGFFGKLLYGFKEYG